MAEVEVRLSVNGDPCRVSVEPRKTLADTLREDLHLTGTHLGCEHGVCGSCTVLVDGTSVSSCLMLALRAEGRRVLTVEGLAEGDRLHPVQQAFLDHWGFQCGYCTPGMLLTAVELLRAEPAPSRESVREALVGNLCRCTGYRKIVDAVLAAAEVMRR